MMRFLTFTITVLLIAAPAWADVERQAVGLLSTVTASAGGSPTFVISVGVFQGETVPDKAHVATYLLFETKKARFAECKEAFFIVGEKRKKLPIQEHEIKYKNVEMLHLDDVTLGDIKRLSANIDTASVKICDDTFKLDKKHGADFRKFIREANATAASK
ncbi:MAG: hypothetical protein LBE32_01845 [Burkholderiales bacterium]|nr:hypothetical protein [Burkholderiales bacterium]